MPDAPYRETLWPRIWVWLMPVVFAASLAVAYGYAYSARAGWLVGLTCAGLLIGGLALSTGTRIEVDKQALRVGRASLPLRFVGRVHALDAQQTFQARTSRADPAAYLVLRPWASNRSVVIEVTDEQDPHPYWLVSTRSPQRLASALATARDTAGTG